jgi:hypothetical protein
MPSTAPLKQKTQIPGKAEVPQLIKKTQSFQKKLKKMKLKKEKYTFLPSKDGSLSEFRIFSSDMGYGTGEEVPIINYPHIGFLVQ